MKRKVKDLGYKEAYLGETVDCPDIVNKSKEPSQEQLLAEIKTGIKDIQETIIKILSNPDTTEQVKDYFSNNENVKMLMKGNEKYEFYRNRKQVFIDKEKGEVYGYV